MGPALPRDLLFRRELERWRGRFDLRVHATVDSAGPDWRGGVGVVTNLIGRARFDPHHTMALVCGPGVMMRFTIQELTPFGAAIPGYLRLPGAQHAMRPRPLRPLPARPLFRLQGRPGVLV